MARAQALVLDASVIVKWFVEEELTLQALAIRDAYHQRTIDILEPALLPFEVLNALRYKPDFGTEDVKAAAKSLTDFQFHVFFLDRALAEKTAEIAFLFGVTIYDASYFALAVLQSCTFVTAEKKLMTKLKDQPGVLHLKDFPLPSPTGGKPTE